MKNISLNIDKALGTVTKEQVYAQAAKATNVMPLYKMVMVQVTTF